LTLCPSGKGKARRVPTGPDLVVLF
jgi:hypothetical protein